MTLAAAPIIGLGTTISIGTQGGSPTYTVIGGDISLTPPAPKAGTYETTTLGQSNIFRTFDKTLIDSGEMELEGFYESADAGQIALQAAFLTAANSAHGSNYPFKLTFPINLPGGQTTTGDVYAFNAIVTAFAVDKVDIEKEIKFKATLKVSGSQTYTEGS